MKVLIVGLGAIGKRHCNNIIELGHDVYAVDLNKDILKSANKKIKASFTCLDEALEVKPEVAVICTFSNQHVQTAVDCVKAGCNIFVEKPLSTSMTGVNKLIDEIKDRHRISMVGCNMRFHPGIKRIYEILKSMPEFRNIVWADLEFGYYLPFAKPEYKRGYQANKKLGGNIIFDCIHEIDYALWFMGKPKKVYCNKGILSDLEIDTQDYADMTIEFENKALCKIHFDYLQHAYSRHCKIIAKNGTVWWDFVLGKVGVSTKKKNSWVWFNARTELYYNKMFIDEMKYFLNCVKNNSDSINNVIDSIDTIKTAMAAIKSSESGKWERINI